MKPIDTKNSIKINSRFTGSKETRTYKYNGKTITDHHYGIDLTGGTKLISIGEGKVIEVVNKGVNGGTSCKVRIQTKDYRLSYVHLKSGSAKVKVGDYVFVGQEIGTMGDTGKATNVHLHLQIDKGNDKTAIDPYDYVFGDKILQPLEKYSKGLYEVKSPRYVRTGAGVEYNIKKVKELTKDGQKHCVNSNPNAYAQYKKGTKFDVLEIIKSKNNSIWGKSPSGYICIESSKGTNYCTKIK